MIDVTPRYLAGYDGPEPVLYRLIGLWGWNHHYNSDLGQTYLTSPDHRFRLGHALIDPGAWWRISAAREALAPPEWMAGFSQNTPAELIAAVTQHLGKQSSATDWTGDTHPAFQRPTDDRTAVIRTLQGAGWTVTESPDGIALEAPDGLARATVRPAADPLDLIDHPHLYVEIGPRDQGLPLWQAMLTTHTPPVVAEAFIQALTDPTPLRRDSEWMDEELLDHLAALRTSTTATAVTEHADQGIPRDHEEKAVRASEQRAAEQPTVAGPAPAAAAVPFTQDDLRHMAAELSARALNGITYHVSAGDQVAEEVIASTRGIGNLTWGELPEPQRALANALIDDLVLDAAGRTEVLVGLEPPSDNLTVLTSRHSIPTVPMPLSDVRFTNEDLYAAAAHVSVQQIRWGSHEAVVAEAMDDTPIRSREMSDGELTWGDLASEDRGWAEHHVHRLLREAAARSSELFDPPWQPSPAPFVLASPTYLAGPGHNPAQAHQPLTRAGWTSDQREGATHYTSPCGRVGATERRTVDGTIWTTASNSLRSKSRTWRAHFGPRTPPEIVAALHTTLASTLAKRPEHLFTPTEQNDTALAHLLDSGWSDYDASPERIRLADHGRLHAAVARLTDPMHLANGESGDWIVTAGVQDFNDAQGWRAQLSEHIPAVLLGAVTTALTDDTPAQRLGRDLPGQHLHLLDVQPLQRAALPPVATSRAAVARMRTSSSPTPPQAISDRHGASPVPTTSTPRSR